MPRPGAISRRGQKKAEKKPRPASKKRLEKRNSSRSSGENRSRTGGIIRRTREIANTLRSSTNRASCRADASRGPSLRHEHRKGKTHEKSQLKVSIGGKQYRCVNDQLKTRQAPTSKPSPSTDTGSKRSIGRSKYAPESFRSTFVGKPSGTVEWKKRRRDFRQKPKLAHDKQLAQRFAVPRVE